MDTLIDIQTSKSYDPCDLSIPTKGRDLIAPADKDLH